jgi:hypothetical protein
MRTLSLTGFSLSNLCKSTQHFKRKEVKKAGKFPFRIKQFPQQNKENSCIDFKSKITIIIEIYVFFLDFKP